MTEFNQVYKCNICENIVEVVRSGIGELSCCGQPMEVLDEKTEDMGMEKHVPVIEKSEDKVKVKIGSEPHPMEEKHHIEWIEIITDDKIYKKFLKPSDEPEAEFKIQIGDFTAREHCNIHGLWKTR